MKDGTATDYSDRKHNSDGSSKRTDRYRREKAAKLLDSAKTIKQISTLFPPLDPQNEKIIGSDVEDNVETFVTEEGDGNYLEDVRSPWEKALYNLLA